MKKLSFDSLLEGKGIKEKVSLCIGVFDGLHLGHQEIFSECLKNSTFPVVLTFNKNPKMFCGKQKKLKSLNTEEQREEFFENLGFKLMIIIDFSKEISKLSAEEFITLLSKKLDIEKLVVGEDFKLGSFKAQAGPNEIRKIFSDLKLGTKVVVASAINDGEGDVISSSKIRDLILKGRLNVVRMMLGSSYLLDLGSIIPAQSSGGELLINKEEINQLLPEHGIFDGFWKEANLKTVITIDDKSLKVTPIPAALRQNRFLEIIQKRGN